jgi:predicted  nucleic acid-binding Zn-ribbon protein
METSVEKKLEALLGLQKIDSKIDEIHKIKGDLPEEVQDLEDEIAGYQTRMEKFKAEKNNLLQEVTFQEHSIKEFQRNIQKYEEQKSNVRNGRELEVIEREMENQELDIKLAQKAIKEVKEKVAQKEEQIDKTQYNIDERNKDLINKRKELEAIIAESSEEEAALLREREIEVRGVDERLYKAYTRIRNNVRNGLAVVKVERDACGGCFAMVPPQRQVDISHKKKIVVCEHCGRILADVIEVIVVEKKKPTTRRKAVEASEEEA